MDKYSELCAFLYRSAKKLISEFEKLLLIVRDEKFPAELGKFVGKLQRLADHATHEMQDLTPVQEEAEEFQITDELCEEAFREGLAVKDFSVAFLQRRFRLKYIDAYNLQYKLRQDGKIKRAFLVGDAVCKG